MPGDDIFCKKCLKKLPLKLRKILCSSCNFYFHVSCTNFKNSKSFFSLKAQGEKWSCNFCSPPVRNKPIKCRTCKKQFTKTDLR